MSNKIIKTTRKDSATESLNESYERRSYSNAGQTSRAPSPKNYSPMQIEKATKTIKRK